MLSVSAAWPSPPVLITAGHAVGGKLSRGLNRRLRWHTTARLCSPRPRRPDRRGLAVAAAYKDPYELLGLNRRTATLDDIKKAYRKRALKLHPDVNKAPDAKERFMEAKQAYSQLLEEHDNGRGRGSASAASSAAGGWGGFGSSSSTYRQTAEGQRRPRQQEEEFYGLGDLLGAAADAVRSAASAARQRAEDLFRDVEKEVADYRHRRAARAGASSAGSSEPKGLWDELWDIGEEFVEFLEQGLATDDEQAAFDSWRTGAGASRSSGSSGRQGAVHSSSSQPGGTASNGTRGHSNSGSTAGQSSSSSTASSNAPPSPPKTAADSVEDELQALKRKLGKL